MPWAYLVAYSEGGLLTIQWPDRTEGKQSVQGGLDYLGSQGWELVTVVQHSSLGTTSTKSEFIFKKPKG